MTTPNQQEPNPTRNEGPVIYSEWRVTSDITRDDDAVGNVSAATPAGQQPNQNASSGNVPRE